MIKLLNANDSIDENKAVAQNGFFDAGLDGNVIISGTVSLTKDACYNNLTVNSGAVLNTAGFRVFVKDTLTNNGTISCSGNPGGNSSGATGGTAGASLVVTNAPLGTSAAGSAGANGTSSTGSNANNVGTLAAGYLRATSITRPTGGSGGSGSAGAGGSGGNPGTTTIYIPFSKALPSANPGWYNGLLTASPNSGAPGGGGGGGDSTNAGGGGGGGGSGGGCVFICAKNLINNGLISAKGGDGGNGFSPVTGNCGGGGAGAGGCGGLVYLIYRTFVSSGSINVAAGTHGTPGTGIGTGTNGTAPAIPALNGAIFKFNVRTGQAE